MEGNLGPKTLSNWFKIEKYENDYKFLFCPTVFNYCKVICRDVGIFIKIFIKNGTRRLALSDNLSEMVVKGYVTNKIIWATLPLMHLYTTLF